MPNEIPQMQSHGNYPMETLDAMYPDIYYRVYPMVKQSAEMYDNPNNPGFYPYPNRTAVNQLTDYVYQRVASEGYYPMERQDGGSLLRALILVLVIRELLRRRGSY